jgi:hypothetical protein
MLQSKQTSRNQRQERSIQTWWKKEEEEKVPKLHAFLCQSKTSGYGMNRIGQDSIAQARVVYFFSFFFFSFPPGVVCLPAYRLLSAVRPRKQRKNKAQKRPKHPAHDGW